MTGLEVRRRRRTGIGWRALAACGLIAVLLLGTAEPVRADITARRVLDAIERGKRYLIRNQKPNGSWTSTNNSLENHRIGITSLAILALLNTGETVESPNVKKGLEYLRTTQVPDSTYDVSLMLQAFALAKDGKKDFARMLSLVQKLERWQIRDGDNAGSWRYGTVGGGDRSNGQFAVLGLREAQEAGIPVSRDTWERARQHFRSCQNPDGGWGYTGRFNRDSYGSMTVAGLATLVITDAMVRLGDQDQLPDGSPNCCSQDEEDPGILAAVRWMGQHFDVTRNPQGSGWYLYYMYGLERAGRLSGRRFFGTGQNRHDWYREGAEYLVGTQTINEGCWSKDGPDGDPMCGTSLSLLFLSKGFAPVIINKLEYGENAAQAEGAKQVWNRHRHDVRNLTQHITGLPKWPKMLNWQVVTMSGATVEDLLQAPILYFNGSDPLAFSLQEVALLRDYVSNGGLIYAEAVCKSEAFEASFRKLVEQMFPKGEGRLQKLPPEHPVFRTEYPLDPKTVELWGVDIGCRTSIIYSPHDWSCLWDKWTSFEVPKRSPQLLAMIAKANKVGVNVVAYATGRELANKLEQAELAQQSAEPEQIERGLIEIAKLRHTGGWDAAPMAVRNLLIALNKTSGTFASTRVKDLTALDPNLFNYPLLYMHGRNNFALNSQEQGKLREYLQRGGVLIADSCCGAPQFDKSFRETIGNLFPDRKLQRIPATHELFSADMAYDLKQVRRREQDQRASDPDAPLGLTVRTVEPYIEGIEIDGKYVVLYSRYDISCGLERQASLACPGYVHEDAVRLAINMVMYALRQ